MASIPEKIRAIEEEMKRTQYNKATEHHIGELKAKIAKLRREQMKPSAKGSGGGFDIRKSGDSSVAFIGFPSVGKSTLLNKLTGAFSEVAAYEFTTLTVIPGVMKYKGANIQLLDLPGIISGASQGRGRGREILSVARGSDLVLIMLDVFQAKTQLEVIQRELATIGIRLNKSPPNVVITKKLRGGVFLNSTVTLTRLNKKTVEKILAVYGIHNADVVVREDITSDELIDVVTGTCVYIPSVIVLNKCDLVDPEYVKEVKKAVGGDALEISAQNSKNLERLREEIYSRLRFMRIYTKPRFGEADLKDPMIVRVNSSVAEICDRIHRELRKNFKYAMIWGASAKFPGQKVGLEHVLKDEDVIMIIGR